MTEGGCLCGAVRYKSAAAAVESGYCHCSLCRRSTGAPVSTWVSFPVAAFSYSKGQPAIYASSSWGHREFCATCGTQICYRDSEGATTVDVNVGSLDDPAACSPQYHIHSIDRIAWFETADALPRYDGGKPQDTPG